MMGTNIDFELFIVETILRIAPQCAKQKNETGLLPLQIVADTERRPYIRDKDRIALVGTIWKAYPDALSIIDNVSGLPPFTLPAVREDSPYTQRVNAHAGLSSSYFLLRQQPEILSEVIGSCQKFVTEQDGEIDEPTATRQWTSPVEGALSQVTVEGCVLSDINGVYKQTERFMVLLNSKEGIIWKGEWTTVEMYRLNDRWRIYIPGYI